MKNSINKNITRKIDFFLKKLYPINRSLTGKGNRTTLKNLKKIIPLKIKNIKSSSKVYTWKVPLEWKIFDAFISDKEGNKIIDFKKDNLHVASYSNKVKQKISWKKLKKKLHYVSRSSNAIPYRTLYYTNDWGFCVTKKQYNILKNLKGKFKVFINSKFIKGSMNYGEYLIQGKSKKEILISTYICHPSLANDNLSGIILTAFLAKYISKIKNLNWSYRVVFAPETIGAISYCKINEMKMKKINYGLVVSCVGGPGKFSYRQSWNKNHFVNQIAEKAFKKLGHKFGTRKFGLNGSDERQYSSQGFKINTVTVSKSQYHTYKEYHTSLDNLKFVKAKNIYKTFRVYQEIIKNFEKRKTYVAANKFCETKLSDHGLYPKLGAAYIPKKNKYSFSDLISWILYYSDGSNTLEEIAKKLIVSPKKIKKINKLLVKKKLLKLNY